MADVHSKATRSYNMSRIRSKNTGPEMFVRRYLFSRGIRYRLHVRSLPGKPDIVLRKYKAIIDVRGCFWHGHSGCKYGDQVTTDSAGISERVRSAKERDHRNEKDWKRLGWRTLVVWDSCELEVKKKVSKRRERVLLNLLKKLKTNSDTGN